MSARIAVAASFTCDSLADPASILLQTVDLHKRMVLDLSDSYNAVWGQLSRPDSTFHHNVGGLNVLLLRWEDLQQEDEDSLQSASQLLAKSILSLQRSSEVPLLVVECKASPHLAASSAERVQAAGQMLTSECSNSRNVVIIPSRDVDALYPTEDGYFDEALLRAAHVPYTDLYFAALALVIVRHAFQRQFAAHFKVLALDGDRTLWGGVVSEDEHLNMTGPHEALQKTALDHHSHGQLLVLISKNDEEDVLRALQAGGMLLERRHFTGLLASWQPKPTALKHFANDIGLGLDSFVFVDDSPLEVASMRANAPEVLTIQWPSDPDTANRLLAHHWAFNVGQHATRTDEDARRSEMAREHLERAEMTQHMAQGGLAGLLDELQVSVEVSHTCGSRTNAEARQIRAMDVLEVGRVAQLTQRTNQFNMTGVRLTEEQVTRWMSSGGQGVLVGSVRDRFGDYGLVLASLWRHCASGVQVEGFYMSCRALDRGVELAALRRTAEMAESAVRATASEAEAKATARGVSVGGEDGAVVDLCWRRTGRNGRALNLVRSVARAVGQQDLRDEDDEGTLGCDAAVLQTLSIDSLEQCATVTPAPVTSPLVSSGAQTSALALSDGLQDIAERLSYPSHLAQQVKQQRAMRWRDDTTSAVRWADSVKDDDALCPWVHVVADVVVQALGLDLSLSQATQTWSSLGVDSHDTMRVFTALHTALVSRGCKVALPHTVFYEYTTPCAVATVLPTLVGDRTATGEIDGGALVLQVAEAVGRVLGRAVEADEWAISLVELGGDELIAPSLAEEVSRVTGREMDSDGIHWLSVEAIARRLRSPSPQQPTIDATQSESSASAGRSCGYEPPKTHGVDRFGRFVESASDPCSPLHAARQGDVGSMLRWLEQGWSPEMSVDKHGVNALSWASGHGHTDVVLALLDAGAAVDAPNKEDTARLLHQRGANPGATTTKGANALMWAVWGRATHVAQWLLDEIGLSMATVNSSGCSAAIWAATSGGVAECEWLRKRGADFTVLNDWGHGAMVRPNPGDGRLAQAKAAWRGNLELLDWLWENVVPARGQIWQKDADGRCPVDLAQAKGHVEAVAWLRAKEMA